jgi:hypothetical protein
MLFEYECRVACSLTTQIVNSAAVVATEHRVTGIGVPYFSVNAPVVDATSEYPRTAGEDFFDATYLICDIIWNEPMYSVFWSVDPLLKPYVYCTCKKARNSQLLGVSLLNGVVANKSGALKVQGWCNLFEHVVGMETSNQVR